MSEKSQRARFIIERHLDDVDEIGAIAIINYLMTEWDIRLSDWDEGEDN